MYTRSAARRGQTGKEIPKTSGECSPGTSTANPPTTSLRIVAHPVSSGHGSHDDRSPVRILAISGSLRQTSSNGALVQAAAELAPDGVEVRVYTQLAELPPSNPDLDGDQPPAAAVQFRPELEALRPS